MLLRTGSTYRPAVDGLRGIAVLSVILFHIHPPMLPGGFVGVDVFFVISGFLISLNILSELKEKRFSLLDFYRRRVKRIAPPLLLVLAVTVVAAQWFLRAGDAERVAESGLWSLLSLANVFFWLHQDTGYFAAASAEKPLLHLWSLGVEEQFYLLWPLLLMLVGSIRRGALLISVLVFAFASVALAVVLYPKDPSLAYYLLPTRAGELLIGAAVAVMVLHWPPLLGPRSSNIVSWLGLAGLGASFFVIDERIPFPGWAALAPTLGAAALIYADHCGQPLPSRLLRFRPLLWTGLVSYSAYLWHWPLLAFWRYGYREVSAPAGFLLFAATFLLAWMTFRWVETPARRSGGSARRVIVTQFFVPGAAVAFFCVVAMKMDGLTFRLDERESLKPAYAYGYVCQLDRVNEKDLQDPRCVTGAKGAAPQVMLWGDSNAAHYVGMVSVFAERLGVSVRNATVHSCPPIDGDPAGLVDAKRIEDCRASLRVILPALRNYPVIVLGGSWTGYAPSILSALTGTAERLAQQGHKVILLGKSPVVAGYDRDCEHKARAFPGASCPAQSLRNAERVEEVNRVLREFAQRTEGVEYFDPNDILCPDGQCRLRNARGELVYYDTSHLTMSASWELGREIVQQAVPEVFATARARP